MGILWPMGFVNKVLLQHSHTHHLCIVYGSFQAVNVAVKYWQQGSCGQQSLKYLLSGPGLHVGHLAASCQKELTGSCGFHCNLW